MQRLYRRLAADLVGTLPPEALLVDIGAGPGHLLRLVAAERPDLRVVAVDRSYAMLKSRPRRQMMETNPGGSRLRRIVGDAAALPLQSGCCDLAVATFSFHTWDHPVSGVKEMHRLVKTGGRVWIYEMNREAAWKQLVALAREEALPGFFVAAGFKLLSWNHALRAGDFAAVFAKAGISGWELTEAHHLFWRATF